MAHLHAIPLERAPAALPVPAAPIGAALEGIDLLLGALLDPSPTFAFGMRWLERHAPSEFENPLTWRFDETDSMVMCDEVKVPWERVFVHMDALLARWPGLSPVAPRVPTTQELLERDAETARAIQAYLDAARTFPVRESRSL